MTLKQIVILGGGFGGVAVAKNLTKQNPHFEITLVNQYPHHSIHGQLYEVATSPDELTYLPELKRSVEVPLQEIFAGENIKVMVATVTDIDFESRKVTTSSKILSYDYLVCALGAQPNFFAIPGAQQFALPFGSSYDALRIRNAVESSIELVKNSLRHDGVRIVIAGGGVGGIEIAAELHGMLDYLAWRDGYPRQKMQIEVLDRGETILTGFPAKVQALAVKRLQALGIKIQTSTTIRSIDAHKILTDKGDQPYDVLIWAAGVRANPLPTKAELPIKKGDRLEVDQYFRLKGFNQVFILGDQCSRLDNNGNPLPGTASQAIDQAEFVSAAIRALSNNYNPPSYSCKTFPYLIPLGPKWVIYSSSTLTLKGYLGYIIRQLVWLRYYISILGLAKGFHRLFRTQELFERND